MNSILKYTTHKGVEDIVDLDKTQVPGLKKRLLAEIKKEMKVSKISQGEIGRRVEILRNNVNAVLRSKSNASLDQLVKIANSINLIIELDVKKKPKGE